MPCRRTATPLLALLAAAMLVACASAERPPSHRRRLADDARSVSFVVSHWLAGLDLRLHVEGGGTVASATWVQLAAPSSALLVDRATAGGG
jgi:outer membrane biogenesis lipoprotein LolB